MPQNFQVFAWERRWRLIGFPDFAGSIIRIPEFSGDPGGRAPSVSRYLPLTCLMYSKTAKAAMHEIPWNAKPTFSSASVISETLYADNINYFFLTAAFFFLPPVFSFWPPFCASSRAPST